jgi:hypothetical protein
VRRIRVARRGSIEVRLAPHSGLDADSISLRDGADDLVDVLRIESGSINAFTNAPLSDGRTGILSASKAVRTLPLLKDGAVVRSIPVRLRAGEPNVIDV